MRVIVCLAFILFIAACTPTPEAITDTPTLAETLTPTITETPPPSNTPLPTGTPVMLPTLPPSWTPLYTPTMMRATQEPTATFTPTIDPNSTLMSQPTREECATFGVDFAQTPSTFTIGADPQVYWRRVEGALNYRITLRDDQFTTLLVMTTGDTSFRFDGDLFAVERNYSWDVRPLDVSGNQLCVSRGSVITAVVG